MAKIDSITDCPPLPEIQGVEVRHCPGFPGYAIGSDAILWSCRGRWGMTPWKPKKFSPSRDGYLMTGLSCNGHDTTIKRARLVAVAFIGPQPTDMEVCHKDGTRYNDRPENLYWGTHSMNMLDAIRMGRRNEAGEHNANSRLSEDDVNLIRYLKCYCSLREIAKLFNITYAHVSRIQLAVAWKHISRSGNVLFKNGRL